MNRRRLLEILGLRHIRRRRSDAQRVHHIEAASNPAWIGTDFMRWYELTPTRVTLRTSPTSDNPLVWERLADNF